MTQLPADRQLIWTDQTNLRIPPSQMWSDQSLFFDRTDQPSPRWQLTLCERLFSSVFREMTIVAQFFIDDAQIWPVPESTARNEK
jgi:hypothetical protein